MLLRLAPRVVAGVTRPGRWSSRQRPPKGHSISPRHHLAASGSNRYPGSARRRHPRLERSRVEKPAADISDAEGRQAVLNRHQPEQLIHVEVRVGFLTQRKADEGRRRKSSDQDIAVGDHLCRAASREHHGSRRVPVDFSGGALDTLVRVELEDEAPAASELDSSSDEGRRSSRRNISLSGDVHAST